MILNNGSSSAPQRKVIAMSKHPVDQLSVCDCEYLIKTPECYLATGDLKRDRKTPFNLKAANKLEGVIPPFVGLFETRITRPIYTGSVS